MSRPWAVFLRSEWTPKLASFLRQLDDRPVIGGGPVSSLAGKILPCVILCAASVFCHGETRLVLCSAGIGSFSSKFTTGVTVTVGAAKIGDFATHMCEAFLSLVAEFKVFSRWFTRSRSQASISGAFCLP